MTNQINFGKSAEDAAAKYLEKRGLKILARNWEARAKALDPWRQGRRIGEIDIIARKGAVFVFVEVKAGKAGMIDPSVHVTPQKEQKLRKLAALWLMYNKKEGSEYQIDVVVVRRKFDGEFEMEHFERAVGAV
ncbi:MAG: hypothetical protein A2806_01485 [Candidatus Terrybacteria bacterium RIFCSPHIGHO2_01_FULL_48_17]|uniref:UPF0102 protein A2806_01485 n=1 Tax=Candidatus Terrybacteria bacterium RIFCSPHIGHO2_01_FULL_48_17 TaxID=1802362 RepID=A0A1G2PJD2_9BACT|nr:MAG: hypothetical protein A2806_01485 [Candidatus Terrybacteria bacterium RIFCSPHIGHO2_01_FULL_48_17]OHA52273.1 MAG: hypothetical protein A3A30_04745 [Candidatus Terrybacteria bacterium RIFCSPLOWO2_01_FULL_48_14]